MEVVEALKSDCGIDAGAFQDCCREGVGVESIVRLGGWGPKACLGYHDVEVGGNVVVVGVDFCDSEVEEDSGLLVEVYLGCVVSSIECLKGSLIVGALGFSYVASGETSPEAMSHEMTVV